MRDLLALEEIRQLAQSSAITSLVHAVIGPEARAVRGIFFDKTPAANWPVQWHQDLSIAVAERNGHRRLAGMVAQTRHPACSAARGDPGTHADREVASR